MSGTSLFMNPDDMIRMDRMSLAAKTRIRGTIQGKRQTRQLGSSLDFADYRLYAPGDDIRQLDWNAYGRTGKPFIKLFLDEQELQVNMFVDVSRSMDFGSENSAVDTNKFLYARRLAASIGYIALSGYDRVGVHLFADHIHERLPMLRGKGSVHRLLHFLANAQPQMSGEIASAFMRPAVLPKQPGMSWVFSDFLYESGVEEALNALIAARQEVAVVQILSPEEVRPTLTGDLRLVDSELGGGKEVAISGKILKAYQSAVFQYTELLRKFCYERGITYMLAVTDVPFSDFVAKQLRQNGLLG